ncbi:hypothetical protein ACHAW5_003004 [Stephanodiscus triporus]|uniref:Sulfotransferase domain-containing protein n=1 Tax=Stephanodiscus triporus TaxID=2934178 RepID=A0ABD3MWE0_9STRA
MSPDLSSLPRFPLSVILSYLQQPPCRIKNSSCDEDKTSLPDSLPHNRDAIALLLTTKRFTHAILPLFRVNRQVCRNYQYQTKDGTLIAVIEKYRFVIFPIQDARTLLDRLNTRRLRARIAWVKKHNVANCMKACKRDETDETTCDQSNTHNHAKNNHNESMETEKCYEYGRTIEELAFEEWSLMEINHADGIMIDGVKDNCLRWRIWPAQLELLRFLDGSYEERHDKLQVHQQKINRQRRSIPSPFCFQSTDKKHNKLRGDKYEETAITNNNLMGGRIFGNGVSLLASYPRSGNTLLRTLLERMTSIVTGSDTRPDRTLSRSLALDHGLVGEGLVRSINPPNTKSLDHFDPLVHIVKTHFPERKGWRPVKGSRVLLLVRNPYDAIDSYWNLCCTNTHTRTLEESVYIKYAQKFDAMARHEIKIWCEFHYYWLDICANEGVPILIVRYEDLVLNIEDEMIRVMKFLLGRHCGVEDGSKMGSFWKWRIRHAIGNAATSVSSEKKSPDESTRICNLGSYTPRSSSGGLSIGKSIRKKRFSDSVLLHMHEVAVSLELERKQKNDASKQQQNNTTLLQRFGYDIYTQHFPVNFTYAPAVSSSDDPRKEYGTVVINRTPEIRGENDPFGRAMTYWRRGETHDDTTPFPIVQ